MVFVLLLRKKNTIGKEIAFGAHKIFRSYELLTNFNQLLMFCSNLVNHSVITLNER